MKLFQRDSSLNDPELNFGANDVVAQRVTTFNSEDSYVKAVRPRGTIKSGFTELSLPRHTCVPIRKVGRKDSRAATTLGHPVDRAIHRQPK